MLRNLKTKFWNSLNKFWPFCLIFIFVGIFFYKVLFFEKVPIPGDFIVGTYFPWLDYKWGFLTGVPVKNPITSDVVSVIYPLRSLVVDIFKSGQFPFWNKFMFAGYPLFANFQAAALAPTMVVYTFLSNIDGWTVQVILQPIISSIFFFLLLRHFGLKKIPSIFGGLSYAFGGFSIIWLEWNTHALVAAFIPLIILLTDKYILSGRVMFGVLLSVSICLQFFSGYPQLVVYTMFAVFVLVLFRLKSLSFSKILRLGIFIVLGFGLSAIQLFPGIELFSQSQRGAEALSKDLIYLPLRDLVVFFAPDFFGNHATGNFWGIGNYANNVNYSGLAVLMIATLALFNLWKEKNIKFFLTLFVLSLVFSLENPITRFISSIGVLGATSNTRILVLANFALAGLCGFGLNLLLVKNKDLKIWPLITFPIFLIAASFYVKNLSDLGFQNYLVAFRNLILPLLISVAVVVVVVIQKYSSNKYFKVLLVLFICIISTFELFRFGWKYTPFSDRKLVFPETPVISYLKNKAGVNRISALNTIPTNMWVPYRLQSIFGYDAVYPNVIAKYLGVARTDNSNANPLGRYGTVENTDSPLLKVANAKYILAKSDDKNIEKLSKEFEDKNVVVYENTGALPRASLVFNWVTISDQNNAYNEIYKDEYINGQKIIISENFDKFAQDNSPSVAVSYEEVGDSKFIVSLDAEKNGFVFVSNTNYPGWNAYIDGIKTKIYKANCAFMAVPVSEGHREVVFIYEPKSFRIGIIVSLVSSFLLIILWIILRKNYRKEPLKN